QSANVMRPRVNTAALPLFRRQPPKKGQGFLPAALRAPLRSFAAGQRARCVWQRDRALPELREPHRQRRRALSRVTPAELEGRGGSESRGVDALTSAGPSRGRGLRLGPENGGSHQRQTKLELV